MGLSSFLVVRKAVAGKANKDTPSPSAPSTSSTEGNSGKTTVRSCKGLIKDFKLSEKQKTLRTYKVNFPVAVSSAYKFETLGQFTIVVAKECNGMHGLPDRGEHIVCARCKELKAGKIYRTLQQRAKKQSKLS